MKKMTKGALVTGLGVALLLGGGGTLAVWNVEQTANAGTMAAGSMELTSSTGVWTSNLSTEPISDITEYRIVPGEELTYTQQLEVGLEGDQLEATLSVDTTGVTNGFSNNLALEDFTVTKAGAADATITGYNGSADVETGTYTASATLAFNADNQEDMNQELDLTHVAYVLDQKAPTPAT